MSLNVEQARFNMVEQQVRPWDVLDARVLGVLSTVPRERFVPAAYRNLAFADLAVPLAHGEVMMRPVLEGRVLQALALTGTESVLEIGTGSGFLAACLGKLARDVLSVERHRDLVDAARAALREAGITNVQVEHADGLAGFDPRREFDAVVLSGAVFRLPAHVKRWVKPGGRLFVIEGESPLQRALLLTHAGDGRFTEETLFETDLPYLANAEPPKRFTL